MINRDWIAFLIVVVMFIFAFYFNNVLPEGEIIVTGFTQEKTSVHLGEKYIHVFVLPIIAFAVLLLLQSLPHIAVYKKNLEQFYQRHHAFKFIILGFIFVVYLANLLPTFGFAMYSHVVITLGLAVVFIYLGHVFKDLRRNYFIGMLSPWALSSDRLWHKTHEFGGAVLEICGVFLLLALIPALHGYILHILAVAVISSVSLALVYSYLIFSRGH